MTSRARLILGGLLFLYVLVVLRAFQIQVLGVREIRDRGAKQYCSTIPLIPKRGVILDRTGTELAVSVATKSIFVQPAKLRDPNKAADLLAPRVSRSAAELRKLFAGEKGFVWVRRQMPSTAAEEAVKEVKQALCALDPEANGRPSAVDGIGTVEEPKRFYPNRELAASVVGFTNLDSEGMEGSRALPEQVPARRAGGAPLRAGRAGPPHRSRDDAGGGEFEGTFGRPHDRPEHPARRRERAPGGGGEVQRPRRHGLGPVPRNGGDPRDGDGPFVQPERPRRRPRARPEEPFPDRQLRARIDLQGLYPCVGPRARGGERHGPVLLRERVLPLRRESDPRHASVRLAHRAGGGQVLQQHRHHEDQRADGREPVLRHDPGLRLRFPNRDRAPGGGPGDRAVPPRLRQPPPARHRRFRPGDLRDSAAAGCRDGGRRQRWKGDETVPCP